MRGSVYKWVGGGVHEWVGELPCGVFLGSKVIPDDLGSLDKSCHTPHANPAAMATPNAVISAKSGFTVGVKGQTISMCTKSHPPTGMPSMSLCNSKSS